MFASVLKPSAAARALAAATAAAEAVTAAAEAVAAKADKLLSSISATVADRLFTSVCSAENDADKLACSLSILEIREDTVSNSFSIVPMLLFVTTKALLKLASTASRRVSAAERLSSNAAAVAEAEFAAVKASAANAEAAAAAAEELSIWLANS